MNRLPRFLKLPLNGKKLLFQALWLVILTRLILWIVPYRLFRKKIAGIINEEKNPAKVNWQKIKEITDSVKTVSRIVPSASCLTQAVAAFWMIKLHGQQSELKIGVAKAAQTKLTAHAWLEIRGRVVLGKLPSHQNYTVLDY